MIAGGFPIDLVILGMIAAFLVLRLRSVLGRRTDLKPGDKQSKPRDSTLIRTALDMKGLVTGPRRESAKPREDDAKPEAIKPERSFPISGSPADQGLASIRLRDPEFDSDRFLSGAERAFKAIVTAFAAGDRPTLRPLLTASTYDAFDAAITSREQAHEVQRTELRGLRSMQIAAAEFPQADRPDIASIAVKFVSDQINLTVDQDGNAVSGIDAVTEIVDLWTFERDIPGRGSKWLLAVTASA